MSKVASIKKVTQKFSSALLCISMFGNFCFGVFGQNSEPATNRTRVTLTRAANELQAFSRVLPFARGAEFVKVLEREIGTEQTRATLALFDEKDKMLFEAVFKAHLANAAKLAERRSAPQPGVITPVKPAPQRTRRGALETVSGGAYFQNAAFAPFAPETDEPVITTVDTADGVKTVGEMKNTVETAETIVTKGSNADTERVLNNSKNGQIYTQTSFEEVYNKQTRGRVRNEKKLQMAYLLAQCPSADGAIEGEASVTIENKATIANTRTIAIPAQTLTMKVRLKGIVNDAAELTTYDLTGEVVETTTGYNRAKDLDMIDDAALSDGTRRFSIEAAGNRIDGANENPDIRQGATDHLSNADNNRLVDFVDQALPMNLVSADNAFKSSRENWRKGFCVDVKLTAPKEKLASGEQITVSAETVHKLDNSKIDARLEASGFAAVSPENQDAKPSAQFSVTAGTDENLGGEITVRSVSRRGIGTATLSFGKEKPTKKPPVKKPVSKTKICTGAWTGKIIVEKRRREEKAKPQSGRLVREVEVSDETFSIGYNLLGIADTSQGLLNAYYAESQMDYRLLKYQESNYAPGKMSCAKKIISSPETRKIESLTTGAARARLTVSVTSSGDRGILSFGSPELQAERVTTIRYETACPDYDRVNSSVDRYPDWIDISVPSFEFEFELDANSRTQLNGSKTIQNEDGSETRVSWALTRECQ